MRYINRDRLEEKLPDGWTQEAAQALTEVRKAFNDASGLARKDRDKAKSDAIKKHSAVWGKVKPALKELSINKCWYCETSLERIIADVEHFRPKNRVDGCSSHEGYWWLSFDAKNLRLACDKCNRLLKDQDASSVGGKGNHFPLENDDKRAYLEADNWRNEQPTLIDPAMAAEPGWLYFHENGKVEPRSDLAPVAERRVKRSIEIFHLYEVELEEARKTMFHLIQLLVDAGDDLYEAAQQGDVHAQTGYNVTRTQLQKMIGAAAEYSAVARCMLLGLRAKGRPWIEEIFQAA